ncbi:ShlB/FhaC/HecB family hemolysin secretion/activation protein [Pontitalea aquivivens]|uniref:ShlB/FhaC/HecB family hemolysin secretion/activation protein n=1 Tax=Pontitalea aquivivens TaxID=3388663 RepID=UPI0039709C24
MTRWRGLVLAAVLGLAVQAAQAETFTLRGVTFSDSIYLTEGQLQGAVAPYLNRPITFDDVQKMLADIDRLYVLSGVVTARAVLLPQEVPDGIVKLDLIEAEIGAVQVEPLGGTRADFIRRNLSVAEGERPDYEALERDLRIFELAHDFVPQLTFGPGEAAGTVNAVIGGDVPERFTWTGSLDNFGTEETGEIRATIAGRWANVSGIRDTLSFQLQGSEGSYSGALGYSRPVGGWQGGRMTATLSYTNSNVIRADFAVLDIVSDTVQASVGYRVPFRVQPDRHFMFDISLVAEDTTSTLGDVPFQTTTLIEIVPQLSWSRKWDRQSLSLSAGLKIGASDTLETSETEGSYALVFGSANYARRVGETLGFEASAIVQLAPDQNLPVPRLISAGGISTMRGYANNIRSGDSGVILHTQISRLVPWDLGERVRVTPFAFADGALVVPYRTDGSINMDQDLLLSVGAGARIDMGADLSGLVMVGVPLRETLGTDDQGGGRFYAGFDYRF